MIEMKLTETIRKDKEIQELKAKYYEMFGVHRPYSIWTDGGIEGYKENMRKSIKEHKKY